MRDKKTFKFLFWELNDPQFHEWEIIEVGVFMRSVSDDFRIKRKCKHCDKRETLKFVEHETLIRMGYKPKEIAKFRHNEI